jgi:hypothetical protein
LRLKIEDGGEWLRERSSVRERERSRTREKKKGKQGERELEIDANYA